MNIQSWGKKTDIRRCGATYPMEFDGDNIVEIDGHLKAIKLGWIEQSKLYNVQINLQLKISWEN